MLNINKTTLYVFQKLLVHLAVYLPVRFRKPACITMNGGKKMCLNVLRFRI